MRALEIMRILIVGMLLGFTSAQAFALQHSMKTIKDKAFFVKGSDGLFEALDLRQRTISFKTADFEACGQSMVRQKESLNYACTLDLPVNAKISRLKEQVTPSVVKVAFGGAQKSVYIKVNQDGNRVTFSTAFDDTGVDFEVSDFNEEFHKVYGKVAQLIISEAMDKQKLSIRVLESEQ